MGQIVLPITFQPDTSANAEDVNANLGTITSVVNGSLDHTNLAANAAIAYSQLVLTGSVKNTDLESPATAAFATGLGADTTFATRDGNWHTWFTRATGLTIPANRWAIAVCGGSIGASTWPNPPAVVNARAALVAGATTTIGPTWELTQSAAFGATPMVVVAWRNGSGSSQAFSARIDVFSYPSTGSVITATVGTGWALTVVI